MKHEIGDVVMVPMVVKGLDRSGLWRLSNGGGISGFINDDDLDICAAAPRVPKVGDRVRKRSEPTEGIVPTYVADIDGEEAIIKWRYTGSGVLEVGVYPLAGLLVVDKEPSK